MEILMNIYNFILNVYIINLLILINDLYLFYIFNYYSNVIHLIKLNFKFFLEYI